MKREDVERIVAESLRLWDGLKTDPTLEPPPPGPEGWTNKSVLCAQFLAARFMCNEILRRLQAQ